MLDLAGLRLSPPVLLAPMAGITDLPFRRIVLGFGAGLVVSEMVASQEMVQARPGTRERAALGLDSAQSAVQLAARDPGWAGEAARMAEDMGARIIDINMGCPARKVVGGLSGAALMRDMALAREIITAIVSAVEVPVTLKMRLGWDAHSLNAPELGAMAEDLGVAMLTVHGRTRAQFYKGHADWRAVRAVKARVGIPVIVNGDIDGPAAARAALVQSGGDGVMVGRAAGGRPWLLAEIAAALYGTPAPTIPRGRALVELVARHVEESVGFYGPGLGVRVIRKHLGWYMDRAATPAGLRREVLTERVPNRLIRLVEAALGVSGEVA